MDTRLVQAINEVLGEDVSKAQIAGAPVVAWGAGQAVKRGALRGAVGRKASTGTPIASLKGVAKARAAVANLGGGAKAVGGKGIDGGGITVRNGAIAVELATFGISGAIIVARIALRYRAIVKAEHVAATTLARWADDKGSTESAPA